MVSKKSSRLALSMLLGRRGARRARQVQRLVQ